jgi:hypothetical protein
LAAGIGDFTTAEAVATIAGLTRVKLELAREAQKRKWPRRTLTVC